MFFAIFIFFMLRKFYYFLNCEFGNLDLIRCLLFKNLILEKKIIWNISHEKVFKDKTKLVEFYAKS